MESELSEIAPADWPRLPIEQVCKRVTSGGTPSRTKPEYYTSGKWGWVKTQELKDGWIDKTEESITDEALAASSAKLLPSKTVLLALYGATVGQLGMLRQEMTCNQACCAMIVDPSRADYRFLFYQLLLSRAQLKRLATGAAQQNLSGQLVKSYKLPFPSLPEQQAISCILGALDDKIELNRRRSRTLEAMAQSIFKSWFVDFDPVRAKAEGSKPAGLSNELVALFPEGFEESELGEIPKGWRVGTLGEVADNPRRGIAADEIDLGTPYIALEHMPRRSIALTDWTDSDQIESNKFRFQRGEILFGKLRPYFHKVGIAPLDGVCSTDILVIVPKQPDWFGFCTGHFSSDAIIQHADRASTGTKMPRTNWSDLARFQVVIPSLEVASAFTKHLAPMIERIHQEIIESRTLAALRDALLPKLISGELRVPDAERIVGRANA